MGADHIQESLRDEVLCRSVFYGALSLALHPPSPESLKSLQSGDTRLALLDAAVLLMARAPTEDGSGEATTPDESAVDLIARVGAWLRTFDSLTLEAWPAAYTRLFGHTARGLVCPYETEYGQEGLFEQPRQLAKIMGFYHAFGLTTRDAERERVDHLSCELEFLDFLSRKEAVALESNDAVLRSETQKATRLFLRDHVGRFGFAFARLLRENAPTEFWGRLGDLLFDFLTLECRRLGLPPGMQLLSLRTAEEDAVPMACGEPSDLIQLKLPG